MREAISRIAVILPLGIARPWAAAVPRQLNRPTWRSARITSKIEASRPGQQRTRFIGNLLESLNNRYVDAELFAPSFKKKIARPRHGNDDDKQAGYNAAQVQGVLGRINSALIATSASMPSRGSWER